MLQDDPSVPFFDLDETTEFVVNSGARIAKKWDRSDRFYWILTVEGTAYFAESGRSQFLSPGWVLAKRGPLTGQIKTGGDGHVWRVLAFAGSNEFTVGRMAYVARHMGKIHKIPLNSKCVKIARKLSQEKKEGSWGRSSLAFEWFHSWWQEAEKHSRQILKHLEKLPGEDHPTHQIVSLKSLADQLGYSPGYLSRLLGKKWSQGPAKSLRKSRMEYAARQLRETSIQVGALANELGYLSESSFVRAFRIHHGQPPERYRKSTCPAQV